MANVFDYLDWRGDIPFHYDTFCEVDNLILSEISYVDMDEVLPDGDSAETISLSEAADAYFSLHTEEELKERTNFTHMTPFLLRKAAQVPRFRSIRVGRFVNRVSKSAQEQMSAMTFFLDDGTAYVAFRGTDDTIIGWKEDLNLSFSAGTAGQKHAAEYLTRNFQDSSRPLRIGGHSKGGNFAVYASAFCDSAVREHIIEIYTNDGPGFLEKITEKKSYRRILPLVRSIIPEGSVCGLLLNSGYTHRVVASDKKGLFQHDGLSWQVLGRHFVEVPATNRASVFMEKTIQQWVGSFSLKERAEFSDAVYEAITAGGADTLTDLNREKLAIHLKNINSFRKKNRQEQEIILSTMRRLFASGVQTFQQGISDGMQSFQQEISDRLSRPPSSG